MAVFAVRFKGVNGESEYFEIEAESKEEISRKVRNSSPWFEHETKMINTANVILVDIVERSTETYSAVDGFVW